MPKEKKVAELSLESVLWNCRVALRGIGGNEKNRDAVMGLVFLKFAGDKFAKRRLEIQEELRAKGTPEKDWAIFLDKPSFYSSKSVFFIPKHCRWAHLVTNASQSYIAVIVDTAMKDIIEKNPALSGALPQGFGK